MLFLNYGEASSNAQILLQALGCPRACEEHLAEEFGRALRLAQGLPVSDKPVPMLEFHESSFLPLLVRSGLIESGHVPDSIKSLSPAERSWASNAISKALQVLEDVDVNIYRFVTLFARNLVYLRCDSGLGGSSASLIGVVWVSPLLEWTPIDFAELLLHESVHLNLYFLDMLRGLYLDSKSLSSPSALTRSALLKIDRPYHLAYHSAFVAASLAHLYELLGDQFKEQYFRKAASDCLPGLLSKKGEYLTDTGLRLLLDLEDKIQPSTMAKALTA